MTLAANTIKPAYGSKRTSKRVGRGNASGKGTMASRGGKGQTARSGGQRGNAMRSLRPSFLKVPKLRGFKSFKNRPVVVTLSTLNKVAKAGDLVNLVFLKDKGIISGTTLSAKIISTGMIDKKVNVEGILASKSAVAAIEKAGGKVTF
jgi:large subunit ribosomal protein L15